MVWLGKKKITTNATTAEQPTKEPLKSTLNEPLKEYVTEIVTQKDDLECNTVEEKLSDASGPEMKMLTAEDFTFSDLVTFTGFPSGSQIQQQEAQNFQQLQQQPCVSPNGNYYAVAEGNRLTVRRVRSQAVVSFFVCSGDISAMAWSPTNEHIMCVIQKRDLVQVFSLSDPAWYGRITEGLAGIAGVHWSPEGSRLFITAEFQVKLTVWCLSQQSSFQLDPPKHPQAGFEFSPDGTMLAVLERKDCNDHLRVYNANTLTTIAHIDALGTEDAADIRWSPDSSCFAVWDHPSRGPLVTIWTPSGECLASFRTQEQHGLGIKALSWSPAGHLLLVGTYEGELTVLNHVNWSPLVWMEHPLILNGHVDTVVYREEQLNSDRTESEISRASNSSPSKAENLNSIVAASSFKEVLKEKRVAAQAGKKGQVLTTSQTTKNKSSERFSPSKPSKSSTRSNALKPLSSPETDLQDELLTSYSIANFPVRIPEINVPVNRPNPRIGIGMAKWSKNGKYLAVRCDERPNVLWIWEISNLGLAAVLMNLKPIKSFAWGTDPTDLCTVAVVCGSRKCYLWNPEGASCFQIPIEGIKATAVEWLSDGSALVLRGKDNACFAYKARRIS